MRGKDEKEEEGSRESKGNEKEEEGNQTAGNMMTEGKRGVERGTPHKRK